MGRVNVNSGTWLLLAAVLAAILAMQVLPQVNLPDTAFQRGTSPVAVHARNSLASIALLPSFLLHQGRYTDDVRSESRLLSRFVKGSAGNSLQLIHRSLRC